MGGDAALRTAIGGLEERLDLSEREPQLLGTLDEADDAHRVVPVGAISGRSPVRLRKQASSFVVAERLAIDARLVGNFAGPHERRLNPVLDYKVKCRKARCSGPCYPGP